MVDIYRGSPSPNRAQLAQRTLDLEVKNILDIVIRSIAIEHQNDIPKVLVCIEMLLHEAFEFWIGRSLGCFGFEQVVAVESKVIEGNCFCQRHKEFLGIEQFDGCCGFAIVPNQNGCAIFLGYQSDGSPVVVS